MCSGLGIPRPGIRMELSTMSKVRPKRLKFKSHRGKLPQQNGRSGDKARAGLEATARSQSVLGPPKRQQTGGAGGKTNRSRLSGGCAARSHKQRARDSASADGRIPGIGPHRRNMTNPNFHRRTFDEVLSIRVCHVCARVQVLASSTHKAFRGCEHSRTL